MKQFAIDDLKKPHQSYPRNEEIATIFYKRGWVEGWGTGTLRMIGYCQKNGTPEPEFQEYSGGFAIVFRFKEPMHTAQEVAAPDKLTLNTRQEKILAILTAVSTMSANELFGRLDTSASIRTIKADLATLKKAGLIEQIGKGPSAQWKKKPS